MRMTNEEWLNSLSSEQRKGLEELKEKLKQEDPAYKYIEAGLPVPDFIYLYPSNMIR